MNMQFILAILDYATNDHVHPFWSTSPNTLPHSSENIYETEILTQLCIDCSKS